MKKILVFLASMLFCLQVKASAEKIAVIVNSESPLFSVKETLEIKDVRNIYLGKIRSWKGSEIKAVNQKNKKILEKFLKKSCEMSVNEYKSYWVRAVIESGADALKVFNDSKDIISFIQTEKAGMGYIFESEVKGAGKIKVVLLIDE